MRGRMERRMRSRLRMFQQVLAAEEYGLPQERVRVVLRGLRTRAQHAPPCLEPFGRRPLQDLRGATRVADRLAPAPAPPEDFLAPLPVTPRESLTQNMRRNLA
eukprot:1541611-Pyramimonas_sp.AAC.1